MASTAGFKKDSFWEFKKYKEHEWFKFLVILLFVIIGVYLVSHLIARDEAKYEYQRLDKEQLQQINRIYFDSVNRIEEGSAIQDANLEETEEDSLSDGETGPTLAKAAPTARRVDSTIIYKSARVVSYIRNLFSNKVDLYQLDSLVRPYLNSALPLEAIGFLGTTRFRVRSYFWLTGPEVYFEIIFWSLFGVLSSLLFNLGMISKNSTTNPNNPLSQFDSSEIPYQFAKLIYAPLCTLAIVLGYNFFNDQNIADISSSKGVIVFAFLGGFYSSRLIAFLDRLKELVLPNSGTPELPVQKSVAALLLQNISLQLQLDESIEAALKNEIAELGLADANVTLTNEENGEQIKASPTPGEDQSSTFTATNLKPGKYKITATWAKDIKGEPLNLDAEQTEDIKNSDQIVNVTLKKASSEG